MKLSLSSNAWFTDQCQIFVSVTKQFICNDFLLGRRSDSCYFLSENKSFCRKYIKMYHISFLITFFFMFSLLKVYNHVHDAHIFRIKYILILIDIILRKPDLNN
jgi:hypothetical protein